MRTSKHRCEVQNYPNPIQFEYVVSLLTAGLSIQQISRVEQENCDSLGTAQKKGCVSSGQDFESSYSLCTVALKLFRTRCLAHGRLRLQVMCQLTTWSLAPGNSH
jgi:hypothetical protein